MSKRIYLKRWRLLLLPIGAVAELSVLAACWVLVVFRSPLAEKLELWACATFPSIYWYIGE